MNYGFDIERERQEVLETDWVFGAESKPCIALIAQADREQYLPDGEVQKGEEDFQDCGSRGPINILEAKFTYLYKNKMLKKENLDWLKANGYVKGNRVVFSDRFIAILSGTTRTGNSMKAPIHAIYENGLIPKDMLPMKKSMDWAAYHDPKSITQEMRALGKEFKRRFTINYERVYLRDFDSLIFEDAINVAGYAWPKAVNGEYPRTDRTPNHIFVAFKSPRYFIFDNYIDSVDKDFIKKLASDYELVDYGYRLFITEGSVEQVSSLVQQLIGLLVQYRDLLMRQLGGVISKFGGVWWK